MKSLQSIALFLCAVSFNACSTNTRSPKGLYLSNPDFYFVDSQGPSAAIFNESVDKAVAGNDDSLKYIISLSRYTDGEGSLSFGEELLQLKKVVGSSRFERALGSVPDQDRKSAMSDMEVALQMRKFVQKTN
jgi:hypothetical protein